MRGDDDHDLDSQRAQPFQQSPATAREGINGIISPGGDSQSNKRPDNTPRSPTTTSTQALLSGNLQSMSSGSNTTTQSQPPLLAQNRVAPVAANGPAPPTVPPFAHGGKIPAFWTPLTTAEATSLYPPKSIAFSLDDGVIYNSKLPDGRFTSVQFLTHRRSSLDLASYEDWIITGIRICVGLDKEHMKFLSTWTRFVPGAIPQQYSPQACLPPSKVDLPKVQLGHLFSTQVFSDDSDIPLYYILLVQGEGQLDRGKIVIASSKAEVVTSAYGEAVCGYSTVFVCAICQSTRTRFLSSNPPMSTLFLNYDRCDALTARDRAQLQDRMIVGVIY
jgi:hypothetical protein